MPRMDSSESDYNFDLKSHAQQHTVATLRITAQQVQDSTIYLFPRQVLFYALRDDSSTQSVLRIPYSSLVSTPATAQGL